MHSTGRILVGIAILSVLILGVAFYTQGILKKDAQKLESIIGEVEVHANEENWTSAENQLSLLEKEWETTEKKWAILLDHVEIDNIGISILRMSKFIETKNMPMATSEIAALKRSINHIPEKESFSLKNVF
ncbi:MAG: DUF4363 family protein [Clostridium sp.]|nr:DUF4363 family protein [Clostridium sp.]